MKKLINKSIVKLAVVSAFTVGVTGTLTGCVGSNAVTAKLMEFNVKAVDNRYARGGLNILMSPIYALTVGADYLVFNSIEFWTGKGIINGNPHIFDSKVDAMWKINDTMDPSLKDAPIGPISNVDHSDKAIYSAQATAVNDSTIDYSITYTNGETAVLRGEKRDELVHFYMDGELITIVSMAELEQHAAATKA